MKTQMQDISVSQASGLALAWLTAKAEGRQADRDFSLDGHFMPGWWVSTMISNVWVQLDDYAQASSRRVDTLLTREGIAIRKGIGGDNKWYAMRSDDLGGAESAQWREYTFKNTKPHAPARKQLYAGDSLGLAVTRCFVASKLGEMVQIPVDLANAPERMTETSANAPSHQDVTQAESATKLEGARTVYFEAYATCDGDGPNFAKREVDQPFIDRLLEFQALSKAKGFKVIYPSSPDWGPGEIAGALQLKRPEMVVTSDDFWFQDLPEGRDLIETPQQSIKQFVDMVLATAPGEVLYMAETPQEQERLKWTVEHFDDSNEHPTTNPAPGAAA